MKYSPFRLLSLALLGCTLSLLAARADVKPFRFAQITDLHLHANPTTAAADLQACLDEINATDGLSFVLVTGDLSEQGDGATMRHVKSKLDKLRVPYYVCMGNHETTWSESGGQAFSQIFGPETFSFDHSGVRFIGFTSGPLLKMAYGHVSPDNLEYIKAKSLDAQTKGMPVIIVTHYPMLDGDVDNWYAVSDAARKAGNVALFIGGHYHSVRELSYDGIPGILMRSTLRDGEGHPGYGLYEVTADSILPSVKRVGQPAVRLASCSLTHPAYDPKGHADHYPDYTMNETYKDVEEMWISQSGGAFYASPAADKTRVYTGNNEGDIEAYSLKNGQRLWKFHTGARIIGGPEVSGGIVVCGSSDNCIYGLRAATGELLWKHETRRPVLGAIRIADGVAYVGACDSTFRAIDVKTGRLKWDYRELRSYVMAKPLVDKDKVVFGAWDNTLYALDLANGRPHWKWTGGLTRMHFSPAAVWPVESNGRIFIVDPQRAMTAIDAATGETIYRTFQSKVRESLGISEDGLRIYAKTMQDSVVCYDTRSNTPRELWACDAKLGYEHGPCMLMECRGIIYGSTKDGVVFAIEGKTGRLLWKHKNGNALVATVRPLKDGSVLFTNTDGQVGRLKFNHKHK